MTSSGQGLHLYSVSLSSLKLTSELKNYHKWKNYTAKAKFQVRRKKGSMKKLCVNKWLVIDIKNQKNIFLLPEGQGITEAADIHDPHSHTRIYVNVGVRLYVCN